MKKLLLLLALFLVPTEVWGQCTGVFPTNTVCGNVSGSPAPPSAVSTAGIGLTQNPVATDYTVQNSDCGQTVVASGGFHTISFGPAAGYGSSCRVIIVNSDPTPDGVVATGAKIIAADSTAGCWPSQDSTYLWPQQSMEVTKVGSVWMNTRCPELWKLPNGTFTVNVNPTLGSDNWGVADGLATGARAFKSINQAIGIVSQMMQPDYVVQTQVNITLCAGCNDTNEVHFPSHGGLPVTSQGGDGFIVNCNNGTLSGGVNLFFYSTLGFINCTFATNPLTATQGALIIFADHINTLNGVEISLSQNAKMRCDGCQINITGSTQRFFNFSGASNANSIVINQTGNVSYSDAFARIQSGSFISIQSWASNAHTHTGKKWAVIECSSIEGSANIQGTIAGDSATCSEIN